MAISRKESLSPQEREALLVADNYGLIQQYKGIGSVTFFELITPPRYKDESGRHYIYMGNILDAGEDEQGPWALIKVASHVMQLEGVEEVAPGHTVSFNSYFQNALEADDPASVLADALEESARMAETYPGTDTYIDLPIPESPQKFYVKDMHTCVYSTGVY
jgi:hypothetical protein